MEQKSFGIAGLLGWPVAHSRSPIIHNHWLRSTASPAATCCWVPPEKLADAVRGLAPLSFAAATSPRRTSRRSCRCSITSTPSRRRSVR